MTYMKHFHTAILVPLRGKLTDAPSGKFCIPIPNARFLKREGRNYTYIRFCKCYNIWGK